MGTTAQKLNRVLQTKSDLKTVINYSGANITNETMFKDYSKLLNKAYIDILDDEGESLYNALPKTTGTGTSIDLDVEKGKMKLKLKANTQQNTSILPSGYTQVDYIESYGTEYIDTEYIPTINDSIEAKFSSSLTSGDKNLYGCRISTNGEDYTIWTNISTGKGIAVHFPITQTTKRDTGWFYTGNIIDNPVVLKVTPEYCYVNNEIKYTFTDTRTPYTGTRTAYIFGQNYNTPSYRGLYKLYYFKIWQGDELKRNYIPCYRNSDNVVGMYDLVNNVFYTNQGTGAFTYGSVAKIPNPDYPQDVEVITGNNNIKISDGTSEQNYPINLGNLEYCNIGNYADQLFKNTTDSEFYDSTLLENEWYLKKNITKHVFEGDDSIDDYAYSTDLANVLAINLLPNKVDQGVIKPKNIYALYSDEFTYINNTNNIEHIYISQPTTTPTGWIGNIRLYINHARLNGYSSSLTNVQKRDLLLNWLSVNPLTVYFIARYPVAIHISETDYPTLHQQLENIYNNVKSYEGDTHITQTNDNLPFNLEVSALAKIE